MPSFNQVTLIGNLCRDPEVKQVRDSQVASFAVAVNRKWKSANGEQKEEVAFIDVECWGQTADFVGRYMTKGRECLVNGRIAQDSWEDKDTGAKRSKLKVVAQTVQGVGARKDAAGSTPPPAPQGAPPPPQDNGGHPVFDDDSPPF